MHYTWNVLGQSKGSDQIIDLKKEFMPASSRTSVSQEDRAEDWSWCVYMTQRKGNSVLFRGPITFPELTGILHCFQMMEGAQGTWNKQSYNRSYKQKWHQLTVSEGDTRGNKSHKATTDKSSPCRLSHYPGHLNTCRKNLYADDVVSTSTVAWEDCRNILTCLDTWTAHPHE